MKNSHIGMDPADKVDYGPTFQELYKQLKHPSKTPIASQNDRRKTLLQSVKERRNNTMDRKRGIEDLFSSREETAPEEEPMDCVVYNKKKKKQRTSYAWKLMLSEYLVELPLDFEHNWAMKFCPVGSRNLIVANHGITTAYNKAGKAIAVFDSMLPSGNGTMAQNNFTILDCIYDFVKSTFVVLDLLAWNGFSLIECSSEFRFFFLKSKLDENPEVAQVSKHNKYAFFEAPAKPAHLPLLEMLLTDPTSFDEEVKLDGILFYHKDIDYKSGITPLVGWLKPYMVPEILHIAVHERFMKDKPANYVSLRKHLEYARQCRKKRKEVVKSDVEMAEAHASIADIEMA